MTLDLVIQAILVPLFKLLPTNMDSDRARVEMLAIGLQESRFTTRVQIGGPARGFWQFETGGVRGVINHPASKAPMASLCAARGVAVDVDAVYQMLAKDDILAAGTARLLLYTDPNPMPDVDDVAGGWAYYQRNWRPGAPKPDTWLALHQQAVEAVEP